MRTLTFCLLMATSLTAWPAETYSCMEQARHRQFDFWVGSWRVTDESREKTYGNNTITVEETGCMLLERWKSASGGTGSSINYYDPSDGAWHQLWVDGGSSIISIAGGLKDGSMVLSGDIYYMAEGRRADFRGSWTPLPDGRVRQFFEERDDQGQWQPWFDGYYQHTGDETQEP